MQRFLKILLVATVVILGFALGRMTGDSLLPSLMTEQKEYPLPPPPPEPSSLPTEAMDDIQERRIILETPAEGASVGSDILVSGRADSSIANLSIALLDEDEETITGTQADLRGTDGFSRFSEIVSIDAAHAADAPLRLVLLVTGTDAKGEKVEEVVRHLVYGQDGMVSVSVYFHNAQRDPNADVCVTIYPLERRIPTDANAYRATIEALLEGPTQQELADGYTTSIPPKVVLEDIGADADGIVTADFNKTLDRNVAGSCRVIAIREQITRTLSQFPETRGVVIAVDGEVDEALQP